MDAGINQPGTESSREAKGNPHSHAMLALFTSVAAFQGPSALPRGAVSRSTSAPRMESANIVDLPGAAQETGG